MELTQFPSVIDLNVGGMFFSTRLNTLQKQPNSTLAVMFSGRFCPDKDSQGRYFIDHDATHFHHILNYLRHNKFPPAESALEVLDEAEYYQLPGLVDWCKQQDCVVVKKLKDQMLDMADKKVGFNPLPVKLLAEEAGRLLQRRPITNCLTTEVTLTKKHEPRAAVSLDFCLAIAFQSSDSRSSARQMFSFGAKPLPSGCVKKGAVPDHTCQIQPQSRTGHDSSLVEKVKLAIFYPDTQCDVVSEVKKAVACFNSCQSSVQLSFHDPPLSTSELQTQCVMCSRKIFFFHLKFITSTQQCMDHSVEYRLIQGMCDQLERFRFGVNGQLITS